MRFKLEQSTQSGWWVLTDTENLVVIKFKEHEFNETQHVSAIDEQLIIKKAQEQGKNPAGYMAHIMSEIGDYMAYHHFSIAMPTPVHEVRLDDDNNVEIIRHKEPRFTIKVESDCDYKQLGDAIRKCGEYIRRLNG